MVNIDRRDIEFAQKRIEPYLRATPLVHSANFSELLKAEVLLKLESLQPTHSFKVRGAFNAALSLSSEERNRGLITATGGNHGLALAYIAQVLQVPATIYVPESTSDERRELIKNYGAKVIVHGRDWDDANAAAIKKAEKQGLAYVHPFDDYHMITGAATIVEELSHQNEQIDLIVASIGGGGLMSGLLEGARHFSPGTRVTGVETEGTDSMFQSRRAGRLVELPEITSFVSSLAARRPGNLTFKIVNEGAADLVTVTDEESVDYALQLLDRDKLLVEPAASCCLAALCSGKIPFEPGEKIVVIMCGANISLSDLWHWSQNSSLLSG